MEDKIYTQSKSELENKLITAYNNVIDTLILFAIEYKDNPKELAKNIEIAENDYWSYFHSNNVNFLLENNCLNKQQAVEILALREKLLNYLLIDGMIFLSNSLTNGFNSENKRIKFLFL